MFIVGLFTFICFALCLQYRKAPEGSERKIEAQKRFVEAMSHRLHLDNSIKLVGKLLFGIEKGPEVLQSVHPGEPLVDDWKCLRTLVCSDFFCHDFSSLQALFSLFLKLL